MTNVNDSTANGRPTNRTSATRRRKWKQRLAHLTRSSGITPSESTTGHNYETRFNRAVFDILIYYFSDEAVRKSALAKKAKVKSVYEALSNNSAFIKSLETTTKSVDATRTRFLTWGQTLGKALGVKVTLPSIGQP